MYIFSQFGFNLCFCRGYMAQQSLAFGQFLISHCTKSVIRHISHVQESFDDTFRSSRVLSSFAFCDLLEDIDWLCAWYICDVHTSKALEKFINIIIQKLDWLERSLSLSLGSLVLTCFCKCGEGLPLMFSPLCRVVAMLFVSLQQSQHLWSCIAVG